MGELKLRDALAATPVDFDTIYATDLVYRPACWKLCGDGHCCGFSRHKARFKVMGHRPGVELPLLPGEYEYLGRTGRLDQFGQHQHRVIDHAFGSRGLRAESIVTDRAGCACAHDLRTTVCRLYPLIPVYDIEGRVTGSQRLGIYDALEEIDGDDRICQVDALPFAELDKFLAIAGAIAREPRALFYLTAYRIAHAHFVERVRAIKADRPVSAFSIFENRFLMRRLFDQEALAAELGTAADAFSARYGSGFALP